MPPSRCCRSTGRGRGSSPTRRTWSCRGRSTRPGSRSTTSPRRWAGGDCGSTPTCRWRCGLPASTSTTPWGRSIAIWRRRAQLDAPARTSTQAAPDRGARAAARRAGQRAGGGRGGRRPAARLRVREPLRDAGPRPQPDAPAAARRERPDRPAALRRRGDGAVGGDHAGRGRAGGRRWRSFCSRSARCGRSACCGARARQVAERGVRAADGRDLARRDRRSGARVRRHGRRHPGARAAADSLGAAGDGRAHGGADRARGAQPAVVDRPQRGAARRRAVDERPTRRAGWSPRSSARSIG